MKKIIYILIVSSIFMSCSGFLDQDPKLSLKDEITLSTYGGLNRATLGLYAPLYSGNWYGANFILTAELRGGNAKNPTVFRGSGRYLDPPRWNFTENNTQPLWNNAYYVIAAANDILDAADKLDYADTVALNNLRAECLFMRALSHFDLVRVFAQPYSYKPEMLGVPYTIKVRGQEGKPARNTIKQCYDYVISDLLRAEKLMNDNYERKESLDSYKAVAQKPAIQALLSRAYLYMGEHQKSADYATKVIKNPAYRLWTGEEYTRVWGEKEGSQEVIFEVHGDSRNEYNASWEEIQYITYPAGYGDVVATSDLLNLFESGDVRGTLFRIYTTPTITYPERWTTKYRGKGVSFPDVSNITVLRLSEMYLNRAEAIHKGATISGVTALSDLNAIAGNRGATLHTTITDDAIYLERRKELCYEGHIVFDHARLQKGIVRTDAFFTNVANKDIPFPNNLWALPIPKTELNTNPNIVQNPS